MWSARPHRCPASAKQELRYVTQGYGNLSLDIQDPVAGGASCNVIACNFSIISRFDWLAQQPFPDSNKFIEDNLNTKGIVHADN